MPDIRSVLLALCGCSALALIFAFSLEHIGGYAPCRMCWWQRYPYFAILLAGAVGIATRRVTLALSVTLVLLLAGAGLAGFHAGVEAGLFALPEGCMAGGDAQTIDELRAQMLNAAPTCDQVSLSFLDLSLSAWNGIFALVLALVAAAALARDWQRH